VQNQGQASAQRQLQLELEDLPLDALVLRRPDTERSIAEKIEAAFAYRRDGAGTSQRGQLVGFVHDRQLRVQPERRQAGPRAGHDAFGRFKSRTVMYGGQTEDAGVAVVVRKSRVD
jgi:hypothetical protein